MVKAIFFDIDGTLVSFKTHSVPFSTIRAIELLRAKGIKVFVATGRHKDTINNLGDLQFDGYVTMNGAYCYAGDQVVFKLPIPREDVANMVELQKNYKEFPIFFLAENRISTNFFNAETEELIKLINFPVPPIEDIDVIKEREIFQMVSFFSADEDSCVMPKLPNCSDARWYPTFTDIINKDASKMVGVQKILDYYGFNPSEAMAFGDGGNNIPMLKAVEYSVAMGNAVEQVKNVAKYVTTDVDNDGILNALQYLSIV